MGFISIILGILAIVLGLMSAGQFYAIIAVIVGLLIGFIGIKQDSSYSKLNILGVLANLTAIGVIVGLPLLAPQQEAPPPPPPPPAAAVKPPQPKAPEPPPVIPQDGEEQDIPEGEIEDVPPPVEQREEVR